MNTILQKRIEEAAEKYAYTNWENNDYHEGAEEGMPFDPIGYLEKCFKEAATFALQNQWISVEEDLPEYDEDVFVRFISRFSNNPNNFEIGYCTRWRTLDESVKTDSKGFSIIGNIEITHWASIPNLEGGEE